MKAWIAWLLLFISYPAAGQTLPKESAQLHYRLIGFSFEKIKHIDNYTVEIAAGNYTDMDSFSKHICNSFTGKGNKITGEAPYWGTAYTWRVIYGDKKLKVSPLCHFSTLYIPAIDTINARLRITKNNGRYSDGYVFLDAARALYDMKGSPVWYLPDIKGAVNDKSTIRDLKVSPQNTITFISDENAFEINYDAAILWKAPNNGKVSGDTSEHYHHDFCRLANGNYMIAGNEYVRWKVPAADFGNTMVVFDASGKQTTNTITDEKLEFGTVIEYNPGGEVVWAWKSSDYFKKTYNQGDRLKKDVLHSHENAFFFDEKNKFVYVSFKNLGQVLKLKYPEGEVTGYYGKKYEPGTLKLTSSAFCEQHSCQVLPGGRLCLFNNNMCHLEAPPDILIFSEPGTANGELVTDWEFPCPVDMNGTKRTTFTQGGNVMALKDGCLFVSMCSPYANLFIVSQNKEIVWEAVYEQWSQARQKWEGTAQYRAHVIMNRDELEMLIWGKYN